VDKRSQLTGDLWGGFAAMLVALPAAIAFGVTIFAPLGAEYAGKGALAGMLGVTALGLIAAGFGGTQRLISAPCAPAAAVLSALALQFVQQGQEPSTIILLLFLIAFATGLLQIGFGALRIGTLIKFMPFQVVSGYLTGVGLIMIFGQLTKLLATPKGMPWWEALKVPEQWALHSVAVGVATAASMVFAPKLTTKIPAVILGLLGGVLVYWFLALSLVPELSNLEGNRFVIGRLSADIGGLVDAAASPWTSILNSPLPKLEHILLPALTLAVLLSIDTLKTCVVLDAMTGSRHRSNKELIGQGLGNLAATVIGGVPGAGTMGATMVNKASGGNSFRSGIFQGIFALIAVLLLTPIIAWVPIASLAALLMVIGWRMIDWHAIELLKHRDTILDFAIIAAVFLVASTYSLIAASAVGVVLAVLLFLTEQIHSSPIRRKSTLAKISSKRVRSTDERNLLSNEGDSCVVVELQGSVFFGTTDQLFQSIEADVNRAQFVVLDFHRVQSLDATAGHMIERVQHIIEERGATLILSRLPSRLPNGRNLKAYVDHIGLHRGNNTTSFEELADALEWVEDEIIRLHKLDLTSSHTLSPTDFDLFSDLTQQEAKQLNQAVHRLHFKKGELIYRYGSEGNSLLLIAAGQVRLSLPTKDERRIHLITLGKGQFFGELSFLDRQPHSADAHAAEDVELIAVDRQELADAIGNDTKVMMLIFRKLGLEIADRLRHSNSEIRELKDL